jgi:hypothetical protein
MRRARPHLLQITQDGITDRAHQRVSSHSLCLGGHDTEQFMFPVQIFQTQAGHLSGPETVDGEEHQHRTGTNVIGLVALGHGEQPLYIAPRRPEW